MGRKNVITKYGISGNRKIKKNKLALGVFNTRILSEQPIRPSNGEFEFRNIKAGFVKKF